jgi:hypothetical protein
MGKTAESTLSVIISNACTCSNENLFVYYVLSLV